MQAEVRQHEDLAKTWPFTCRPASPRKEQVLFFLVPLTTMVMAHLRQRYVLDTSIEELRLSNEIPRGTRFRAPDYPLLKSLGIEGSDGSKEGLSTVRSDGLKSKAKGPDLKILRSP